MKRVLIISMSLFFGMVQSLCAGSFKIVGTRPLGMGGAHVAVAEDAIAQYWNPAGFARQRAIDIQVPLGLGMKTTRGLIKEVDDLAKLVEQANKIKANQESGTYDPKTLKEFMNIVNELEDLNQSGLGVIIDGHLGAEVRLGNLGVGILNTTEMAGDPTLDFKFGLGDTADSAWKQLADSGALDYNQDGAAGNSTLSAEEQQVADYLKGVIDKSGVSLPGGWDSGDIAQELVTAGVDAGLSLEEIQQAGEIVSENADTLAAITDGFSGNQSNVTLTGISLTELAVTYARPLLKENLYVGANAKFMRGDVGFYRQDVFAGEELQKALYSNFDKNHKASYAIGVDAGVLYDLRKSWRTKVGMVIRNLNKPTFKQPDAGKAAGLDDISVSPQMRVGVAVYPLNFITLAADMDITKNETVLDGFKSQNLGLGAELNILNKPSLNLALRAGVMKNLAEKDVGSVLTAGVGLNLLHFNVDVGGAISTKTTEVADGKKYPTSAVASATLSLNF